MITIDKETDRLYMPDYGVATLELGDGGTLISDVESKDGFFGICFAEASDVKGVGDEHQNNPGDTVVEHGAYLQILTKNPKSLDVLIEAAQRAKADLEATLAAAES